MNIPSIRSAVATSAAIMLLAACASVGERSAPLRFDADGRPMTDVVINDERRFPFVIDTAAQRSALGRRVVEEMDLAPEPGVKAQIHGAGGAAFVDLYRIKSIEAANVTLRDVLLFVPPHEPPSDADGVIGADFFGGASVRLDFADGAAAFCGQVDGGEAAIEAPISIIHGNLAIVDAVYEGVALRALIDTGAKESIANLQLMEALGLTENARLSASEEPMGVTAHVQTIHRGMAGALAIGGAELAGAGLAFSDLPVFVQLGLADAPAMILGMDVLRRFGWIEIDYEARVFRADPAVD